MIEFKKVALSDKEWIDRVLKFSDFYGAEYNFTNAFIWGDIFNSKIGRFKDFLLARSGEWGERRYLFPAGKGNLREAIELLMEDAIREESPFEMIALNRESREQLKKLYPNRFKFIQTRESFDYIYQVPKMISLSGKKLQSKRNHINFFTQNYNWQLQDLTFDKIDEVKEFLHLWCKQHKCTKTETLHWEMCAVKKALENYRALELKGLILRVEGEIIGFTVGEALNSNSFVVHVEKVLNDFKGGYQFINREFLKWHASQFEYVNREDDIGDEGLRRAKESYYPIFMVEKYRALLF
ncbi:MAG: phosphatidylglycerol lysyltransferase domain-containing protein [Bacteroidales bacterium]